MSGEGWITFDFSSGHAKLQKGRKYYVVLNDTSPTDYGHWNWYNQYDTALDDNVDEGDFYYKLGEHTSNAWNPENRDLLLQIRALPINNDGSAKSYTSPQQVNFNYTT